MMEFIDAFYNVLLSNCYEFVTSFSRASGNGFTVLVLLF